MTITRADWHDLLPVLRETYTIWSAGLSRQKYHDHIWRQINHPWAKSHFRFMVLKDRDRVVASCKLYRLEVGLRGKIYRLIGLGAIYTQVESRNQGFATRLVHEVIESAQSDKTDGLILFSDIGSDFYLRLGFSEFGSADFIADLEDTDSKSLASAHGDVVSAPAREHDTTGPASILESPDAAEALELDHIPMLQRIYSHWARTQPFAVERSPLYWQFKLARERFLSDNSQLAWPRLSLLTADDPSAYAIVEQGGGALRILEIVGKRASRETIWLKIFSMAGSSGIRLVRGWEAVTIDLKPTYNLAEVLPRDIALRLTEEPLGYYERDWGRPMLLPLTPDLEDWLDINPCPILELDHL